MEGQSGATSGRGYPSLRPSVAGQGLRAQPPVRARRFGRDVPSEAGAGILGSVGFIADGGSSA